jgi:hypothetical protein
MKRNSLLFGDICLVLYIMVACFLLGSVATAQVPYSTKTFSATFNNVVSVSTEDNVAHTSTNTYYSSKNGVIEQTLAVRTIKAGIAVDKSSLDFYAGQAQKHGEALKYRSDGTFQGHIATFVRLEVAATPDRDAAMRELYLIIVNENTVIILAQDAPKGTDDLADWKQFYGSLVINETTCWLPEGCK